MKGLEISKKFFLEYGKPMLEEKFSHLLPYIAVGLVGSGSERYGYDDDVSRDHDFQPDFCIFIPDESVVDRKSEFELERAYYKLPKEYMGYKRTWVEAVGGGRRGVIRTADFYKEKTGSSDGTLCKEQWLNIPEHYLLEATNGEIFLDNLGEFSKIREKLSYFPEDIRLKKLAGNLLLMAQSGQYNYPRCIRRKETASAQLSVYEFTKSAINVLFLLAKKYAPYYKWTFRALREVSVEYSEISEKLEFLISSGNDTDVLGKKSNIIQDVCEYVLKELVSQNLTDEDKPEMELLSYQVNDKIVDAEIRNSHVLSAV